MADARTILAKTTPAPGGEELISRRRRPSVGWILLNVVGLLFAVIWIFPVYWMLNSSLLPNTVLQSLRPVFVPFGGSFDNFAAVLDEGTFLPALRMSLAITGITVLVCLLFGFLAALAISRFRFRGRASFVLAVLLIQMLPAEGLFIAQYKLMGSLNLLNSVIGVSLLYAAAVVPFTIWMLRGFVAGVPIVSVLHCSPQQSPTVRRWRRSRFQRAFLRAPTA